MIQPTLACLTRRHLSQEFAHFRRGVGNCPADLTVANVSIAGVVKLKGQGSISRRPDNVLRLVDISQWMRVGACGGQTRGARGGLGRRNADLARGGMSLHRQRAQLGRALSPGGKHADALNRRVGSGIGMGILRKHRQRPGRAIGRPTAQNPERVQGQGKGVGSAISVQTHFSLDRQSAGCARTAT